MSLLSTTEMATTQEITRWITKQHVLPHNEATSAYVLAKFREKHNSNKTQVDVMVKELNCLRKSIMELARNEIKVMKTAAAVEKKLMINNIPVTILGQKSVQLMPYLIQLTHYMNNFFLY